MAELVIEGSDLVVRLNMMEKLEAVHGGVRVPLRRSRRSRSSTTPWTRSTGSAWARAFRGPSPSAPSAPRTAKIFAVVHHDTRRGVRVILEGDHFDELIVGCSDPEAVAASLRQPG